MKRIFAFVIVMMALWGTSGVNAQNRWNATVGGSISHKTTSLRVDGYSFSWGGGAFVAGGYEINFTPHWSLNPQLELGFVNDGATLRYKGDKLGLGNDARKYLNLDIPIIASYRFSVNQDLGFRVGVGPVLQGCMAGWGKDSAGKTVSLHGIFGHRVNIGLQGEAAVETGRHLSYIVGVRYPFAKENWMGETLSLSLGLRYSF